MLFHIGSRINSCGESDTKIGPLYGDANELQRLADDGNESATILLSAQAAPVTLLARQGLHTSCDSRRTGDFAVKLIVRYRKWPFRDVQAGRASEM